MNTYELSYVVAVVVAVVVVVVVLLVGSSEGQECVCILCFLINEYLF